MSTNSDHTSLPDLVEQIRQALADLEAGKLDLAAMAELTDQSRELHERLVVLRYKAFERFAKEGESGAHGFRISAHVDRAQITLLDAIEEIQNEQKPEEPTDLFSQAPAEETPVAEAPSPQPQPEPEPEIEPEPVSAPEDEPETSFTIQAEPEPKPEPEPEPEPEAAIQEAPEPDVEEETPEPEAPSTAPSAPPKSQDAPLSIVEQLAKDEESLVQRLGRAPLEKIQGNISLNQKFLLINELFDGDTDQYNETVTALDNAGDREAALQLVQGLGDAESEGLNLITELIIRRYA